MEKVKVQVQGVLVASVLLALAALPVARAAAGGSTFPAGAHAATHCDCETR